ncbi:transcription elongation factor [Solitalea canadensis]|uniref:Transcription elongation factor n=1 Tax=Solitalea canadensis (strain ATCC 29591 / DSM 3403 / JCM 21819 / LMG 8368 / NBRC 15130 / NCIMB 12057 / USAM 9D) TaxID=929556 RepID=H8KQ53_SOLCM|nr:transcription elongation factor [Solitalea canadensis]AFD06221.1 transcription elongation factor [Solitalea canadensis DSM 3403]
MNTIKQHIYEACQFYIDQRVKTIENAIASAKEAASDDTKSSAGDKYETTREMMQQEIDRNTAQLNEALKLKQALSLIDPQQQSTVAQNGSLVITNNGNFYLSISAGAIDIDGTIYFAVSPVSPIGNKLLKLKRGDSIRFNGKDYQVNELL